MPVEPLDLLWFPVIVFVQLVLTLGLALLVSALTVHFRDVRDLLPNLLTLWFFATPIIYPLSHGARRRPATAEPEPVHAPGGVVPGSALRAAARSRQWRRLLALAVAAVARRASCVGYFVFDRLRDTLAEEV